jgi:hypothetical protein
MFSAIKISLLSFVVHAATNIAIHFIDAVKSPMIDFLGKSHKYITVGTHIFFAVEIAIICQMYIYFKSVIDCNFILDVEKDLESRKKLTQSANTETTELSSQI